MSDMRIVPDNVYQRLGTDVQHWGLTSVEELLEVKTWARAIGWVSMGVTLASVVAPDALGRALGIGERPRLIRALGARDLLVGAGLVFAPDPTSWLRARFASELFDAVLLGTGTATGRFDRRTGLTVAVSAAAIAVLEYALLHQLQHH